jgi:hypothetical protein
MVNNGYGRQMAINAVASGCVDPVPAAGFFPHQDLVERLRKGAAVNPLMESATFYGGGAHGYRCRDTGRTGTAIQQGKFISRNSLSRDRIARDLAREPARELAREPA